MTICVFGASSRTIDEYFSERTRLLSRKLAERGHSLMFGGGNNGLMGAAARGFSDGGGYITGVAPRFFDTQDILYKTCDSFVYPDSMRDRKKYMEDNSAAFLVTPGGIGTYEEFFEVLTLKQLARHGKPIVLYNINGFYDRLLKIIEEDTASGFVRAQTLSLFLVSDNDDEIIDYTENGTVSEDSISFYD